eukprot:gene17998-46041_t
MRTSCRAGMMGFAVVGGVALRQPPAASEVQRAKCGERSAASEAAVLEERRTDTGSQSFLEWMYEADFHAKEEGVGPLRELGAYNKAHA